MRKKNIPAFLCEQLIEKFEQKFKGSITPSKLSRIFGDQDSDNDGFITLAQFKQAITMSGNALSDIEAEFLFHFWDTMAEQQPAQGAIEIGVAVADLVASVPSYNGGFRSGEEGFKMKGAKGNQPSQEGGIFGGGAYMADANGMAADYPKRGPSVPMAAPSMEMGFQKPKNNQSSIEGGIFGTGGAPSAPPSSRSSRNRSNQSSIEGGIFGTADPIQMPRVQKKNSNQSSIPGGIFG